MSDDSYDRLSNAAESLNKRTEELMTFIKTTEERLAKLKLGVAWWLEGAEDMLVRNSSNNSAWQLGFAKYQDSESWKLMVRRVTYETTGHQSNPAYKVRITENQRLLTTAPRLVRVEAVEKFDKLFEALASRAEGFAASISGRLTTKGTK